MLTIENIHPKKRKTVHPVAHFIYWGNPAIEISMAKNGNIEPRRIAIVFITHKGNIVLFLSLMTDNITCITGGSNIKIKGINQSNICYIL